MSSEPFFYFLIQRSKKSLVFPFSLHCLVTSRHEKYTFPVALICKAHRSKKSLSTRDDVIRWILKNNRLQLSWLPTINSSPCAKADAEVANTFIFKEKNLWFNASFVILALWSQSNQILYCISHANLVNICYFLWSLKVWSLCNSFNISQVSNK